VARIGACYGCLSTRVVLGLVGVGAGDHSSSSVHWLMMASFELHLEILVGISCKSVALVEKMHFVLWALTFRAGDINRVKEGVEMVVVGNWHCWEVLSAVKVVMVLMAF